MTRKPKPLAARTDLRDPIGDVLNRKQKRVDVEIAINGKRFIAVVYRLNDAVPVRIDLKPVTQKVPV